MDCTNGFDVKLETRNKILGQDGDAVFVAFATSDDDVVLGKIDVGDPEANEFHDAHSGAVEEGCHECGESVQGIDDGFDFRGGENDGESFGELGFSKVGEVAGFEGENGFVKKNESVECLVLGGGSDVFFDGEVGEEVGDVRRTECAGVLFVMKEDEVADPSDVGFLGADAVVAFADLGANLIEKAWWIGVGHSDGAGFAGPQERGDNSDLYTCHGRRTDGNTESA